MTTPKLCIRLRAPQGLIVWQAEGTWPLRTRDAQPAADLLVK